MHNEIGCPLKLHKDTILRFDDTSGAAAVAQRKVDKEAYYALSWDSKELSKKLSQ